MQWTSIKVIEMLKFNIKAIMEFRDARETREIRKAKRTGKSPEVQNSPQFTQISRCQSKLIKVEGQGSRVQGQGSRVNG
jgi:hypothetical protein